MDPMVMQLLQMYQGSHNGQMPPGIGQPGGMFGAQPQPQLPTGQPQTPALPPMGQDPNAQHHHGFNPLMLLSPMGGLMASNPKLGMSLMSPAFGLANLFGAFK